MQSKLRKIFSLVYQGLISNGMIDPRAPIWSERSIESFVNKIGLEDECHLNFYMNGRVDIANEVFEKFCRIYEVNINLINSESPNLFKENSQVFGNLIYVDEKTCCGEANITDECFLSLKRGEDPNLKGEHYIFVVTGNSMEGTLYEGDSIITKKIENSYCLKERSIYTIRRKGRQSITKRFIRKEFSEDTNECIALLFQSDNGKKIISIACDDEIIDIFQFVKKITERF
jgi:Peptidase S24-like